MSSPQSLTSVADDGILLCGFDCRTLLESFLLQVGIMEGVSCPVGIATGSGHSEVLCQVYHVGNRLGISFLDWFIFSNP